jgi:hypothetical protein
VSQETQRPYLFIGKTCFKIIHKEPKIGFVLSDKMKWGKKHGAEVKEWTRSALEE